MKLEQTILKTLIYNEDYLRKVLPFLKREYFSTNVEKLVYNEITSFTQTYNKAPTIEALVLPSKKRLILQMMNYRSAKLISKKLDLIKKQVPKFNGLLIKPKSSVKRKQYTTQYLGRFLFLTGKTNNTTKVRFPRYYRTLYL